MTDNRRKYPVTLQWAELAPQRFAPSIRDEHLELIEPFLDYSIYRANQKIAQRAEVDSCRSTIQTVAYALKDFTEYLRRKNKRWTDVTDAVLEGFRNQAFDETVRSRKGSQDELTAK